MRAKNWVDVLEPRRRGSDLLWLTLHNYYCKEYKYSQRRNPEQIRDDVFNEPYIQVGF